MEKILPWFVLKSVPGIGNHLFKRLIDRFHSPELALKASGKDLSEIEGMTPRLVTAIKQHRLPDRVKKDIDLVMHNGYKIVTMSDIDYPPLLLQIPDPPPFLYVLGHLISPLNNIAVVGSRNATRYGISSTQQLCKELASFEITIVSGMALGIDSAAHEGALLGKGHTIAVLGSGLEVIYPKENRKLFYEIAEKGAVISEFPLRAEPEPKNFPIRNRIISGICLGTVVVEATNKSGSLITARLAAEQGRDVFAVPGSIHSFKSIGTHTLIKQGAKLVEHAQDIMEEFLYVMDVPDRKETLNQDRIGPTLASLSSDESLVYDALESYPIHIDDLVQKLSMGPGKLSSILLQLELKGMVKQSPGKFFSLTD
ncbi:MAG: DNA-processing protein DprA [Desulfobacterales bacterium]|nr:MAG: DNA-processing protein DprA [Desulfobacterales bacterium]